MNMKRVNWQKLVDDYRVQNPESKLTDVEIIQNHIEQAWNEEKMDKKLKTYPALVGMKK